MNWIINGTFQHKKSKLVFCSQFIVVTKSKEDPIEVLHKHFDLSNMIYLRGVVNKIHNRAFQMSPWKKISED
jgi:hypothetical protein